MSTMEHYRQIFADADMVGKDIDWLAAGREKALAEFEQSGFPTSRNEDWKYTRVNPIEKKAWNWSGKTCVGLDPEDLNDYVFERKNSHVLVFVNGWFQPQLSTKHELPQGVTLSSMAAQIADGADELKPYLGKIAQNNNGFMALNTAFSNDGAYLHVAQNVTLDKPVQLVFIATRQSDPVFTNTRNLIVLERGAQAQVVETYGFIGGEPENFTNAITEAVVAEGARLYHNIAQRESEQGYHVSTVAATVAKDGHFEQNAIAIGARLMRTDINVALTEPGAHATLNGLYLPHKRQHMDYHTFIDHAAPRCTSEEVYRGVLDDAGRGVFNGKVLVREGAVQTNADQSNKNLLLSKQAEVDTKPQLEIFNDDVKCSHGATIGQLNDLHIFYLRSRGLDEGQARSMLTYAFANEVVNRISLEPLRDRMSMAILDRMPGGEELKKLV